jgi:hypothetical protein
VPVRCVSPGMQSRWWLRQSTKIHTQYQGLQLLSTVPRCRCRTRPFASGIIRRHRKAIGSRWRKLNPGQQALLVLAYLRKGETFAQLAAGFGSARRPPGGTRRRPSEMPSGFAASGGDVSVTPPPGNAASLPIASLAGNRRAWPAASARITTRVPITSRSHAV